MITFADFSGYWVLSKTEHFDDFLKSLGVPWIIRKAALQFGTNAVDIIAHAGTTVRITSLNAKGSWTRSYDTENTIVQPNAEGVQCKTTSWWEGAVLHTKLEGSPLGTCISTRYRRGNALVVKTSIKPPQPQRPEATCYWWFERMENLQKHMGGGSKHSLLRALNSDQDRILQATRRDNLYLQHLLLDFQRWVSPADDFIRVVSPAVLGSRGSSSLSRKDRHRGGGASPVPSPQGISKSPSTSSVSTMSSPTDGRYDASSRSGTGANGASAAANSSINVSKPSFTREVTFAPSRQHQSQQQQQQVDSHKLPSGSAPHQTSVSNEITFPALKHTEPAPLVSTPAPASIADQESFKKLRSLESMGAASAAAAATVPKRPLHYRSPSTDSVASIPVSQALTPHGNSPSQTAPPTGTEALMVLKMHEFLDSRGILAVIPVANPNDTSEPQLLSMSPEQAEETAAKLRELETEMLLRRQEIARGITCCGLVLTRKKDTIPDHLRVWEMTLV